MDSLIEGSRYDYFLVSSDAEDSTNAYVLCDSGPTSKYKAYGFTITSYGFAKGLLKMSAVRLVVRLICFT